MAYFGSAQNTQLLEVFFARTAMMPVFLRPFTNALIIYLPGQR